MAWFKLFNSISNSSIRLFCFHYGGGSASIFRGWIKDLVSFAELIAVQLPGREDRFNEPLLYDISHVVDKLSRHIDCYIDKPFIFFGHSVGTTIAFELTRALRKKGMLQPKHLIVSGTNAPQIFIKKPPIYNLPDPQFITKLKKYNGIPDLVIKNKDLMTLFLPILRADFCISETYTYFVEEPLKCPLTTLGGLNDNTFNYSDLLKWKKQTTNSFNHYSLPGDHFFIKSSYKEVIKIVNQILYEENK